MNRSYLLILIIPLVYLPCYLSNDLLRQLTEEDGLYETIGALFFLIASFLFFVLAAKPHFYNPNRDYNNKLVKLYFLGFGLLFFFAFGEEISWGQRIFKFSTPEYIDDFNRQGEFNLHNIGIFHGKHEDGEEKSGFLALFTMNRLFYSTFLTYLLIIPFIYNKWKFAKSVIDKFFIPVPPILLGVLFGVNLIYAKLLRYLSAEIENDGLIEIKETVYAFIILLLPLYWIYFKARKFILHDAN